MRRRTLNLIVPFIILTISLSFVAVLAASNQNTGPIITKLEELRGKVENEHPALENKVKAVIHQIKAGAFNGALNKLQNDVKKSIIAWVDDPDKQEELLDLVDEIIDLIKGIIPPKPPKADFEITAEPMELEIMQGSSDHVTITITSKNGFSQEVALTNATSAQGVTLSLEPSVVVPPANGLVTSTLAIEVASDADPGDYEIMVTGTSGSLEHSVEILLKVAAVTPPPPPPDFSITASPDTLITQQGDSNTSVITITSLQGFNQPVDLAITSDPITGVAATLNPTQVIPPSNSFAISILTTDVATNAPLGSYSINVTGQSGALTRTATVSLQVTAPPTPPTPDFSVNAAPIALTIEQGGSAASTIIVVSLRGFSQSVALAVTSAPISGVQLTLDPSQVTPEPNGFITSTLRISVENTATPNDYEITVAGTSDALTRTVSISLTITVETTPPEIVSVMRLPATPSYNETVTVFASVSDMVSGINEVILGYSGDTAWKNVTTTLQEGLHRASIPAFRFGSTVDYRVYASDKAGNWAVSSVYSYVVVDPYSPVLGVPYWSPLEPAANEEITINVTAREPLDASGIDEVLLWYTNETLDVWLSIPMTFTGANWTAVLDNQSGTAVEFSVEAFDKAGNSAETETQEFTVAPSPSVPLAWILALIIAIAALIGGTAYYVERKQRKRRTTETLVSAV